MSPETLRSIGLEFRRAVGVAAPFDQTFARLKRFPRGCCKDASFILARILDTEYGIADTEYVWGITDSESGSDTHGWLEVNGPIMDVTADQFPDINEPVLVIPRDESEFHARFELQSRSRYPRFWKFHPEAAPDFEHAFRSVLTELRKS